MSYCRFSDDDFRCELYAYQSVSGRYLLHLAASRIRWEPHRPSPYDPGNWDLPPEEFARVHQEYHQALENAPRLPIDLPGAGETLQLDTLEELQDAIREHVGQGFQAPDWLIPSIKEEIQEGERT